ncbi:hypothetical protein [Dyella sp. 20L07]|uniref:hypothetical protein n=1 Tax=Dyella sp. 20L07 TaxID=3384240 RepID=UPI003D291A75
MRRSLVLLLLAPLGNVAVADENPIHDINFTGPLLTPSAAALPSGVINIEPYLIYT